MKSFVLKILVISLIISLCEFLSADRYKKIIRSVSAILLVWVFISFISGLEIHLPQRINIPKEDMYQSTIPTIENELDGIIKDKCLENDIELNSVRTKIDFSNNHYKILQIKIDGKDIILAKKFISSYFNIDPAYIVNNGDTYENKRTDKE